MSRKPLITLVERTAELVRRWQDAGGDVAALPPGVAAGLPMVFGASEFVADAARRDSSLLAGLACSGELGRARREGESTTLAAELAAEVATALEDRDAHPGDRVEELEGRRESGDATPDDGDVGGGGHGRLRHGPSLSGAPAPDDATPPGGTGTRSAGRPIVTTSRPRSGNRSAPSPLPAARSRQDDEGVTHEHLGPHRTPRDAKCK